LQFGVAIALTTVLPLLTLVYMFSSGTSALNLPEIALWALAFILTGMVCLGYGLLIKYPVTIINLRRYIEKVAHGEIPNSVDLPKGESDITAIQNYFNLIIAQMKKRINIIEEQQAALIKAERQRVMTESLCTACHHLGQPATTMVCYLEFLKKETLSPSGIENLTRCIEEADRMRATLQSLQKITRYRTEPYCTSSEESKDKSQQIIQVAGDSGAQSLRTIELMRNSFSNEVEPFGIGA